MSDERNWKITKTFRLAPEAIEALERASAETQLSQGELIENCILEKIEEVLAKRRARRSLLKEASALREGALDSAANKPAKLSKRSQN